MRMRVAFVFLFILSSNNKRFVLLISIAAAMVEVKLCINHFSRTVRKVDEICKVSLFKSNAWFGVVFEIKFQTK